LLDELIAYHDETKGFKLAGSVDYIALHGWSLSTNVLYFLLHVMTVFCPTYTQISLGSLWFCGIL